MIVPIGQAWHLCGTGRSRHSKADRQACEIPLRAERKAGQLLKQREKNKGGGDHRSNGPTGAGTTGAVPTSRLSAPGSRLPGADGRPSGFDRRRRSLPAVRGCSLDRSRLNSARRRCGPGDRRAGRRTSPAIVGIQRSRCSISRRPAPGFDLVIKVLPDLAPGGPRWFRVPGGGGDLK